MILHCNTCQCKTEHDVTTITIAGRKVRIYVCRECSSEKSGDAV